jgi:predicted metal-dependent hydrolase
MFRPDHMYIPGINERHPENLFETICKTVNPGASIEELASCDAFKHGLMYLDEGYFWEAHEVFEPVWMALPHESEERLFVQGLIQLANASLKAKMQRPKAVQKLCQIARELLHGTTHSNTIMNLDQKMYLQRIDTLEATTKLSL